MNRYNVVRSRHDDGGGGESLPAILEAVLDGEVSATDSRVVETLRSDAEAARRFKETQRVADRLSRRIATPDLSGSILAVVHAKQPYAAVRRRRRVSPQRMAFAGGLIAGISLVVVLQTVGRHPRLEAARTGSSSVASVAAPRTESGNAPAGDVSPAVASVPSPRPRTSLAFHDPARYEAGISFSAPVRNVKVAGLAGDMRVSDSVAMTTIVPAASALPVDPCVESPSGYAAVAGVASRTAWPLDTISTRAAWASGTATRTDAVEPGQEWPPADISAFIDHIEKCGVSEELARSN